jgi:hypothetical protein
MQSPPTSLPSTKALPDSARQGDVAKALAPLFYAFSDGGSAPRVAVYVDTVREFPARVVSAAVEALKRGEGLKSTGFLPSTAEVHAACRREQHRRAGSARTSVTKENYGQKAVDYTRSQGSVPVIDRAAKPKQWQAWQRYFADLGMTASVSFMENAREMTVPSEWPQWFDALWTYGGPVKAEPREVVEICPPGELRRREARVKASQIFLAERDAVLAELGRAMSMAAPRALSDMAGLQGNEPWTLADTQQRIDELTEQILRSDLGRAA